MPAIFRLIIITSLYASITGMVIIALKALLRNRINPRWHYIIWSILVLKLLIPYGPESSASIYTVIPRIPRYFEAVRASGQSNFEGINMGQNKSDNLDKGINKDNSINHDESYIKDENISHRTGTQQHFLYWSLNPYIKKSLRGLYEAAVPTLSYIWLLGVLLMACWLSYTNLSLRRRIKKSAYSVPADIQRLLYECKAQSGVKGSVKVVIQDVVSAPALFGIFDTRILLTPDVLKLDKKDMTYILLHELSHYKRKDLMINHLLLILQIIHWFNPFIWYCFKRMRQDMELAADERVLEMLESGEQKEYGKALLAVVESFSMPKLAPKLISMVDDRKNIEKRIRMIKMMKLFKNRQRVIFAIGIFCVVLLSGFLLTSGITDGSSRQNGDKNKDGSIHYNADKLFKHKTLYVGDNSKVGNLVGNLPFSEMRGVISLKTDSMPYGINVKYDLTEAGEGINKEVALYNNAAILFALIDNVDIISFDVKLKSNEQSFRYTRAQMEIDFKEDLRLYAKDLNTLNEFLYKLSIQLKSDPEINDIQGSTGENVSEQDKADALKVLEEYFNAFADADYDTMISLSTEYHNKELVHDGDVWGMKWARAKEIKNVMNADHLKADATAPIVVFDVSVDMETVKTSAQYPSTQTSFYVILVKDAGGIWRVDRYTTG